MGGRACAAQSRADADRMGDLPRRRRIPPPTIRRPTGPTTNPSVAARRSDRPAEEASVRARRWSEERHKQAEAEVLDAVIAAEKEAETHGTLHAR